MMTRITSMLVAASVIVAGLILGWTSAPPTGAAVNELYLNIHAGTESGTADMTCTWHTACSSANTGPLALDWSQNGGWPVHWHSWATYLGYATAAGYGTVSQSNSVCYRVLVEVDRPNGSDLGDSFFTHTHSAVTGQFTIGAGSFGNPYWTDRRVGTTVNYASDLTNCDYVETHIHQYATSPFARNTTRYPNNYPPASPIYGVDITSQTEYQNYVSYQY